MIHSQDRRAAIEAHNLHVRYPQTHALRGVDIVIEDGAFALVGGPSGSGKSTLAHALLGLVPRSTSADVTGRLSVADLDPRQHEVAEIATRAGLVFQNPVTQMFSGTVAEEIAFGPRNLGMAADATADRVEAALEAVGAAHLRGRAVRHLSGGEQQRVAIAASLAMRPDVLVLDEPLANLDSDGARAVTEALVRLHRRWGVTVVVIEHRLEMLAPHADRLIWLEAGRVVDDGPPDEVLTRVLPPWSPPPPLRTSSGTPLVALDGVAAGYDGRTVLEECSLTLRRGDFAALVGPNGAGKTTLARVLAGLIRPRRGRVVWHANGRKPRVGLLQQNPVHQLVCDTVEEEVNFGPRNWGLERADDLERVMAQTDLHSLRRRSTQALSVGQQQRTALAATLALRPALLVLDEPTLGQDQWHMRRLMGMLRAFHRAGQTILLITHNQRLVKRYASRVWELDEGAVVERLAADACPQTSNAEETAAKT